MSHNPSSKLHARRYVGDACVRMVRLQKMETSLWSKKCLSQNLRVCSLSMTKLVRLKTGAWKKLDVYSK